MFAYDVLTEQEAIEERYQLLKEGIYDAVIVRSEDRQSKNGSPMMDITLQVFDDSGKAKEVRDFLVFIKQMMWKVIHFADSAGLKDIYEQGGLCSEVAIGNRVKVKIAIEEGGEIPLDKLKGKPAGSKYPDKNKVEDYIKKEDQVAAKQGDSAPFLDDDIPI